MHRGSQHRWPGIVRPRRPHTGEFRSLTADAVTLVMAEADRSQNNRTCEGRARHEVAGLDVVVTDGTSHHNIIEKGAAAIAETVTVAADPRRVRGRDE
ncbi:hypothetical protein AAFP35_12060 [Gordonia sp. CPCC 206044]